MNRSLSNPEKLKMEEIKIYYWPNEKQRKGKELHSENSIVRHKVFKAEKIITSSQ